MYKILITTYNTYHHIAPKYICDLITPLGVIFDQFINFDDHITAICRSTHFHIRNIGKIRNLLSYDACSTIIHELICCRLDYCNSILYNVPKSKTDRLQRIQNQCQGTKRITRQYSLLRTSAPQEVLVRTGQHWSVYTREAS